MILVLDLVVQNLKVGVPLVLPEQIVATTDASLQSWGAHCLGHQAQDRWKNMEAYGSNVLELEEVHWALAVQRAFLC